MRNAVSPTRRIAAGLLLAILLSVVGYQVLRRLNSHAPDALLKRADEVSWLCEITCINFPNHTKIYTIKVCFCI